MDGEIQPPGMPVAAKVAKHRPVIGSRVGEEAFAMRGLGDGGWHDGGGSEGSESLRIGDEECGYRRAEIL